jgi:hypothetical protein
MTRHWPPRIRRALPEIRLTGHADTVHLRKMPQMRRRILCFRHSRTTMLP